MTPEQYQRVIELFQEARQRAPSDCDDFLRRACGDDDALRHRVASMLSHDACPAVDLETPIFGDRLGTSALGNVFHSVAPNRHPERIGDYRILDVLGVGGMGVVYRAEQQSPRRHVALKIVRLPHLSDRTLRRFELEVEALGRLNHACIAQIYEAGVAQTDSGGQPYIAMELLEGRTLTDFARNRPLSVRARLELFASICDAVHHAHQRGIIHRDLKPENIVVVEKAPKPGPRDANLFNGRRHRPVLQSPDQPITESSHHRIPKVLDFGIARLMNGDYDAMTRNTESGRLMGTLAYMSPEQVAGRAEDLDSRSDIYALGVLLWELLAGKRPFDPKCAAVADAVRIVMEAQIPRLGSVDRAYRGDLETIVAKAVAKDVAVRYQSASDLAADIRRYLADVPITARPPSLAYQLHKFAQRRRVAVGVAALFAVALLLGVIGTISGWQTALAERDAAEFARREADRQARIASAINDFLNRDLLAAANPIRGDQADMTLREAVDAAAVRLDSRFDDEPLVEAGIRSTLADTYRGLGEYESALKQAEVAFVMYAEVLGRDHPQTLLVAAKRADLLHAADRFDDALHSAEDVLNRRRRVLGAHALPTLVSQCTLGSLLAELNRLDEADNLLSDAFARLRELPGAEPTQVVRAADRLARVKRTRGQLAEAENLAAWNVEKLTETFGNDQLRTLNAMQFLAGVQMRRGKLDEASRVLEAVVGAFDRLPYSTVPSALRARRSLANAWMHLGRYDDAESLLIETIEMERASSGDSERVTLGLVQMLARVYLHTGRAVQALPHLEHVYTARKQSLGENHLNTLAAGGNLGIAYDYVGRTTDAQSLLEATLEGYGASLGATHPSTIDVIEELAGVFERALVLHLQAADGARESLADDHWKRGNYLLGAARCLSHVGKTDDARRAADDARAILAAALPEDHPLRDAAAELVAALNGDDPPNAITDQR